MELTDIDYKILRDYMEDTLGLSGKKLDRERVLHLLEPVVRISGCDSFGQFLLKLSDQQNPKMKSRIIAAMAANGTSFFRDRQPFDVFRDHVIPALCQLVRDRKARPYNRRGSKVSLWCSAAATGQEPYSLAMLLHDALRNDRVPGVQPEDFSILASDISSEALSKAVSGLYDDEEITQGLPANFRERYFTKEGDNWAIHSDIQKLVKFRCINLVEPFRFLGGFDIIFSRNLLPFFRGPMQTLILEQFEHLLTADGLLFLGTSESVTDVTDKFEPHYLNRTLVYKKSMASRS